MPKIIENIREQLLNETRAQVERQGYGRTTIRSVANACGIAVGTVYNYFPSKDIMIASYMAEDWGKCLQEMRTHCGETAETVLRGIYDGLCSFIGRYQPLFQDETAGKAYAAASPARHAQLRRQIASLVIPLCDGRDEQERQYLASFIAEAVIIWALAGTPFDTLYNVLRKLIKEDYDREQF